MLIAIEIIDRSGILDKDLGTYFLDFPSIPRIGELIRVETFLDGSNDIGELKEKAHSLVFYVTYITWGKDSKGVYPHLICIGV